MAQDNLAYQVDDDVYPEAPWVRRAYIPPDLTYETMSELGKELYRSSMEIAESGEGLQTEEELEREIARRRGEYLNAEFISAEKPTKPLYQAYSNALSIY